MYMFLCLEYCGIRVVLIVEIFDYFIILGNKFNLKINIMWIGKLFFYYLILLFCFFF